MTTTTLAGLGQTAELPRSRQQLGHCKSAAISDGKQLSGAKSEWHARCPVAVRTTRPVKSGTGSGQRTVGCEPVLLICTCTCHLEGLTNQYEPNAVCTQCGNRHSDEVDPQTWLCIDVEACLAAVQQRADDNPLMIKLRESTQAGETARAAKRADRRRNQVTDGAPATKAAKAPRERKPARPKTGRCQHCGEPTKGGLFVAGHDAKLKGQLQRVAIDSGRPKAERVDAIAEQILRGWHKGDYPDTLTKTIRGAGDSEEAKAADQRTKREKAVEQYSALRDQAAKRAADPDLLDRLVKQRIGG